MRWPFNALLRANSELISVAFEKERRSGSTRSNVRASGLPPRLCVSARIDSEIIARPLRLRRKVAEDYAVLEGGHGHVGMRDKRAR